MASGSRAESRVVPSPWRRMENRVRRRASASCAASRLPSASSARSGATTVRMCRPIRASCFGAKRAACSMSAASARSSTSVGTPAGSSSRARTTARACTVVTRPSRTAAPRAVHRRSRAVARNRSARASSKRPRVASASQSAALRAPVLSATSLASTRIRIRSSATRDSMRASATSASALSAVGMKAGLVSATDLRVSSMTEAADRMGCDTWGPPLDDGALSRTRVTLNGRRSWRPTGGYYLPSQLVLSQPGRRTI